MYARHNQTITPRAPFAHQADDNPMGDIGKKISDFFSGLMPKDEEPPTHARWSEQGGPPCGGGRGHPVAASLRPLSTTSTATQPHSPPLSSGVLRVYLDDPVARQPRPLRRAEAPCLGPQHDQIRQAAFSVSFSTTGPRRPRRTRPTASRRPRRTREATSRLRTRTPHPTPLPLCTRPPERS